MTADWCTICLANERRALDTDPEGTMGCAYDARVTPHMYVIDAEGTLVYMGGIDSTPKAPIRPTSREPFPTW